MKEIVQRQLAASIATVQAVLADGSIADTNRTPERAHRGFDEDRRQAAGGR